MEELELLVGWRELDLGRGRRRSHPLRSHLAHQHPLPACCRSSVTNLHRYPPGAHYFGAPTTRTCLTLLRCRAYGPRATERQLHGVLGRLPEGALEPCS